MAVALLLAATVGVDGALPGEGVVLLTGLPHFLIEREDDVLGHQIQGLLI